MELVRKEEDMERAIYGQTVFFVIVQRQRKFDNALFGFVPEKGHACTMILEW